MAKPKYEKWLEAENLLKLEAWARDGLTDKQIAENMGINVSTLYKYKNEQKEINDALKKGKEVADIQVENALFKSCLGYTYDEITQERNHEGEMVQTKIVTKRVAPNTTAQIFWLKNRKPDVWRDKQQIDAKLESKTGSELTELIKQREERRKNKK